MIDLKRARDDANFTETQLDRLHGPLIRLMADEIEQHRKTLFKIKVITGDPIEGFESTVDACHDLACGGLSDNRERTDG